MKILLSLFVLALVSYSANSSAFVAVCNNDPGSAAMNDGFFEHKENHRLIQSRVELECMVKNQIFSVTLTTTGPGLQFEGFDGIVIACPLVSSKRLNRVIEKKGSWGAVGAGASAGAFFGARAGVALNHRGALCSIAGGSLMSFGAGAGVMNIKFQ